MMRQADVEALGQLLPTYARVVRDGKEIKILARVDNHIVAARQGNMVVTSFHPELTADLTVHQYFLRLVQQKAKTCVA